ncbi:hypothetical protein GWI33_016443 [Rhynchophorus ferrugineus]|uniref:Uncharacterized protein n=1 Tax=Rhynchophorus ferrugineus TaxID=354439 RepID=A0A834HXF4_RHYFE|nr:hypothetical protein GWI33_016443 [Rhynchophorus ferrugineus]
MRKKEFIGYFTVRPRDALDQRRSSRYGVLLAVYLTRYLLPNSSFTRTSDRRHVPGSRLSDNRQENRQFHPIWRRHGRPSTSSRLRERETATQDSSSSS